ncbi:MAG: carboxypeptidase-like regulatory domain-containing protein [Minisyncoccales bacterium]
MKNFKTKAIYVFIVVLILTSGFFGFDSSITSTMTKGVFASTTDGTIDSTYKYAWAENIGWVNFGAANGDVHITDSGLSGYALGENVGWLYLGDITNDGQGNLSGYAWAENVGWLNFAPTNGGVIINSSGEFTGSALGENIGWIIFGGDYPVKTDWRPQSARPACNNATDDDSDGLTDYPDDPGCDSLTDNDETDPASSGGGGLPSGAYNPPASPSPSSQNPQGEFKVLINNDEEYTNDRIVTLSLNGGPDAKRMAISENADFYGAGQEAYQTTRTWTLTENEEEKTIYVKFYTQYGQASQIVSDTIIYQKEKEEPIIEIPEIIKKIPEKIKKIPEILEPLIPEFLKPEPEEIEEEPEEIITVPEQAPVALSDRWSLLTYTLQNKPFTKFTLAPLPKEIKELAEKFPELGETLKKVGITKILDVEKLKAVELTLSGLTERMGLPTAKVEPGKFALPAGVPVAELSTEIKQEIPAEIVFAKTAGELIDFNIALSVTEKGKPRQKITTISGKPLQLVVKPDQPVKSVKGYVVFKSKTPRSASFEFPFNQLAASLIFANPVFAQEHNPVEIEERLVLLEFEYTDPDGDGIYTAEIQAPLVEGEYEIITVMDYEDLELKKEIRLIIVVDPEGYVYEKDGNKETRIPGAIISIYWLNLETKQYELWPAKEYQQENPQITNTTGKYSFLVPEGSYYLKVEAPGYLIYDGKPFQVKEGSGVHKNIELKTKYWWLKVVDWKTILLIVVILLLLYNFYRDRIREKLLKSKKL